MFIFLKTYYHRPQSGLKHKGIIIPFTLEKQQYISHYWFDLISRVSLGIGHCYLCKEIWGSLQITPTVPIKEVKARLWLKFHCFNYRFGRNLVKENSLDRSDILHLPPPANQERWRNQFCKFCLFLRGLFHSNSAATFLKPLKNTLKSALYHNWQQKCLR